MFLWWDFFHFHISVQAVQPGAQGLHFQRDHVSLGAQTLEGRWPVSREANRLVFFFLRFIYYLRPRVCFDFIVAVPALVDFRRNVAGTVVQTISHFLFAVFLLAELLTKATEHEDIAASEDTLLLWE